MLKERSSKSRIQLIALLAFLIGEQNGWGAEPIKLFNGRDLTGWISWLRESKHEDPEKVFSVVDNELRISGAGYGYLATQETFDNYRLNLEFRWGNQQGLDRKERTGKALDSGLFIHASGPHGNSHDGDGAYMAAIECNIYQGATGDFLLIRGDDDDGNLIVPRITVAQSKENDSDGFPIWDANGGLRKLSTFGRVNWIGKSKHWEDQLNFTGPNDIEKPYGEWNQLECLCIDRSITVRLNGHVVNQVTEIEPFQGKILLQCEGAEIFFRNILVKIPAQRAGHWFGVYKTPGLSPQRGLSDSVVPTGSVIG